MSENKLHPLSPPPLSIIPTPPTRGPQPGKSGRPFLAIPWDWVGQYLERGAEAQEICEALGGIDTQTLYNRFLADQVDTPEDQRYTYSEWAQTKRAVFKRSVREGQLEIMQGGNSTMAIFLGKQVLGQKDERHLHLDNHSSSVLEPTQELTDEEKAAHGARSVATIGELEDAELSDD